MRPRSSPTTACSTSRVRPESLNRIRALSPHIGARGELHGRPVTIWRRGSRTASSCRWRCSRKAARGCRTRRFSAACGTWKSRPPARPPTTSSAGSLEEGAYADRALRSASEGLDDRDRALARQLAFGSVQRMRTLDHAIETLGKRPVRKLDPPVLAALRLGAYQLGYLGGVPRYAAVNESVELVRRANLERAVPFTNAVLRRVSRGDRAAPRGPAGGAAQALLSGLDLGRLAARPRRGGSARADARSERAATRRCQTRPGTVPGRGRNGHPERLHRRTRRRASSRRGPDLAAEPRLAARRARRRLAGGGARPRPLRGAGREGDDARGRRGRGRGERSPGARARGERPHGSAPRTCASSTPTGSRCRPS